MSAQAERVFDQALHEAANGRVELTAELLALSPTDLAAYDPSVWERIGASHRSEVFTRLCGEPVAAQPHVRTNSWVYAAANERLIELAWAISLVPIPVRGFVLGLWCSLICIGFVALTLVIDPGSLDPVTTPIGECPRLMLPEGGCVYRVQSNRLTWSEAATTIGVDEHALKAGNREIARFPLARGTEILISPQMAFEPKE